LLDILLAIHAVPAPKVEVQDTPFSLFAADLCYSTPDGSRSLARSLSFCIDEGESWVLRGDSGCGKSSLVRCIAGLWHADSGKLGRPPFGRDGLMVLPQRPYMCLGSLRQQVFYPQPEVTGDDAVDAEISDLLKVLGLQKTLAFYGLDGTASPSWEEVLSLGEQQRLSFARLLFTRPRFAILDEASSGLDIALETTCMQLLVDEEIAMLTIAHRPSLVRYHQKMLTMNSDGTFDIAPLVGVTPC